MRAGHQWPDAVPNRLAQLLLHTDPPSTALNATQVSWQFFAAHARKMLTVLVPEVLPYQPVEFFRRELPAMTR